MDLNNKKVLVAFFSHSGKNYVNGNVVDLTIGNTKVVAKYISEITKADTFEIESINAYPNDYNECTSVARKELNADFRPKLKSDIVIDDYDVIFLGYPNWWGTMPMPVWTFIESYDFTKKIILPFCTHEGSQMGSSENDLRMLLPDIVIKRGLAIRGSEANNSKAKVQKWIERA